jgi:hypothetical protein
MSHAFDFFVAMLAILCADFCGDDMLDWHAVNSYVYFGHLILLENKSKERITQCAPLWFLVRLPDLTTISNKDSKYSLSLLGI